MFNHVVSVCWLCGWKFIQLHNDTLKHSQPPLCPLNYIHENKKNNNREKRGIKLNNQGGYGGIKQEKQETKTVLISFKSFFLFLTNCVNTYQQFYNLIVNNN